MTPSFPKPAEAAIKIWFSGFVAGPPFFGLILLAHSLLERESIGGWEAGPLLKAWLVVTLAGAVCSLPSLLLLGLALRFWLKERLGRDNFVFLILAITFALTMLPFVVISCFVGLRFWTDEPVLLGVIGAYLAASWLGVFWVFRRTKFEQEPDASSPLDADI